MATRLLLRRDTAANWTSVNPTLALGEEGVETDTLRRKFGDGVTAWTSLAYAVRPPADLDGDTGALVTAGTGTLATALRAALVPQVADPTELTSFVTSLAPGTSYVVVQRSPFDIFQGVKP